MSTKDVIVECRLARDIIFNLAVEHQSQAIRRSIFVGRESLTTECLTSVNDKIRKKAYASGDEFISDMRSLCTALKAVGWEPHLISIFNDGLLQCERLFHPQIVDNKKTKRLYMETNHVPTFLENALESNNRGEITVNQLVYSLRCHGMKHFAELRERRRSRTNGSSQVRLLVEILIFLILCLHQNASRNSYSRSSLLSTPSHQLQLQTASAERAANLRRQRSV
jgi:hypothetical protein